MGWICHHGFVVTSWDKGLIEAARNRASMLFGAARVTEVLASPVNTYHTFLIGPDGSKEGWSESDEGDAQRKEYTAWLHSERYEDGSSSFEWFEYENDVDGRTVKMLSHTFSVGAGGESK